MVPALITMGATLKGENAGSAPLPKSIEAFALPSQPKTWLNELSFRPDEALESEKLCSLGVQATNIIE